MTNSRTITYSPNIGRVLLLGGTPMLIMLAKAIRGIGLEVQCYTSPRQAAEIGEHNEPIIIADDINPLLEKQDIDDRTLVFGMGEAWVFGEAVRAKLGDRLIDIMGIPLPRYRGGAHYTWAIMRGDRHWGGALQLVTANTIPGEYDDGEIIAQWDYDIPAFCKIPQDWFNYCGARDVAEIVAVIQTMRQGKPFTLRKISTEKSLFFPRLKTADNGWIDWSGSYQAVTNMINAFDRPYPGARTFLYTPEGGDRLVILRNPLPVWKNPCAVPYQRGLIVATDPKGITVSCIDGELVIKEVISDGIDITAKVRVGQRLITPPDRLDMAMRTVAHYSPMVSL